MSTQAAAVKQPKFDELKNSFKFFPFMNQVQAYLVLLILGVIFNITSLHNEYALDDGIIIHQNEFVLKGSKGIDSILTRDAYRSFYKRMNATDQLSGGRYRPLSVVSFAMEQEYLHPYKNGVYDAKTGPNTYNCWDLNGNDKNDPEEDINEDGVFNEVDCQVNGATLRHAVNIFTYIIAVLLLYMFFSTCIFKDAQDIAFLSALLFLMHPMHTEVIANVKSRDEIFSLIFISLTFFFSYKYVDYKNYFGKPSFALNGSPEVKKILLVLVSAVTLFLIYFMRHAGFLVLLSSVAIGGLIIYRSYNSFIRNKQYTKIELLFWAFLSFFLALLSKEYAIMLLMLVPFCFFIFKKVELDLKNIVIWGILLGVCLAPGIYTKNIFYGLLGAGAFMIALHMKAPKDIVDLFSPFVLFLVSAVLMLYMKANKTGPRPKDYFVALPFIFGGVIFLAYFKIIKSHNLYSLMIFMYSAFLFYWAMRLTAVVIKPSVPDTEILNNPYLLATGEEKWASKIYVLFKYLRLLVFPHPLSSDYSYNTIEYRHFSSPDFLFSLALHLALGALTVYLFIKRHVLGFALLVYFAFLMMIGNILMDIGATMGERLIFHSSIGFAIAVAWLLIKGLDKLPSLNFNVRRAGLILLLAGAGFLYGCKYWERNWDWKNDITLFIKDANTVPNSVLVLGNAGARWVDLADTRFFNVPPNDTVKPPFSTFKDEMLNITISDKELKNGLTRDSIIIPNTTGNQQGLNRRQLCLYKGIGYLKHATQLHPRYVNGYLNLGLAYYKLKRDREALFYWKHAERLYPNNPYLKNYYIVFYNDLLGRGYQKAQRQQLDSAVYELNKCIILDKLNPEGWYQLGGAYYTKKNYAEAKRCWEECIRLNPSHAQAKQGLSTIVTTTVSIPVDKK
ncbi:MAG: tetratricopeptide repeat protein [Bacteroidetes bacterium]|nr:tetratricopeptide repeat protein [Bacteroidota bacterium]